jgi:tetratricopeptide (TPR) repeat protein
LDRGRISENYIQEKSFFRQAIMLSSRRTLSESEKSLLPQVLTNYANSLDTIGRPVEALDYYERAIKLVPDHPEALVNKAIVLKRLSFHAYGHTHLFLLESKELLNKASSLSHDPYLDEYIQSNLEAIEKVIHAHNGAFRNEEYEEEQQPVSSFHEFLRRFCLTHGLYLTPTSLITRHENQILGDPLFISRMTAELKDTEKFDRYISFFNQIKQDYIFSRYLLVQSQYKANHADVIDLDVDYYYPLDYSAYSSYTEMTKVAYRLATDTLDKVAFFVRDYYKINSLKVRDTNFRTVWSDGKDPYRLRSELSQHRNNLLFGFLDMALDLKKGGHLSFIQDRRNALTHRFLALHMESVSHNDQTKEFPRMTIDGFINETILVLQLLKAAIIHLILLVDVEERNNHVEGIVMPSFSTKSDGALRWTPVAGEGN